MLRHILAILAVTVCLPFAAEAAPTAEEARQYVDRVGSQVLSLINTPELAEEDKKQRLQQIFVEHVDIPWMGRFVLGHYWQKANAEERQRYLDAYQSYLLANYTTNFTDYSGSKYQITDVRDQGNGQFTILMQIDAPQQQTPTEAGYRLRADDQGNFKIRDIIIEGVSLITTQRSEFTSVLQRNGMNQLISELESRRNMARIGEAWPQQHSAALTPQTKLLLYYNMLNHPAQPIQFFRISN
jgi:phospholipid transport system substrate-binding protein